MTPRARPIHSRLSSLCALAILFACAVVSPRHARAQYSVYGPGPIAITDGQSNPYGPAAFVEASSVPYFIDKVTVTLHGFTHTYPDDVDILLVQPAFNRKVILMSDVGGGTDASNLTITIDPDAPTSLPDNTALFSGTYRPTDFETGELFPAPAPAGPYQSLGEIHDTVGWNDWQLFIVDDDNQDTGTLVSWSLTFHVRDQKFAAAFDSPVSFVPADLNTTVSEVYPNILNIFGLDGPISGVTVTLLMTHLYPSDLDILLVGPDGTSCLLMSDCGAPVPIDFAAMTFASTATLPVPAIIPPSGVYVPTNYTGDDVFPVPAPPPPYTTSLAPFIGKSGNGTWRLFMVDAFPEEDDGALIQWSIQLNGREFCSGDYNKSGNVSVQDILDFLSAYFAGCP